MISGKFLIHMELSHLTPQRTSAWARIPGQAPGGRRYGRADVNAGFLCSAGNHAVRSGGPAGNFVRETRTGQEALPGEGRARPAPGRRRGHLSVSVTVCPHASPRWRGGGPGRLRMPARRAGRIFRAAARSRSMVPRRRAPGRGPGPGMIDRPPGQARRQHQVAVGGGNAAVAQRMEPEPDAAGVADARVQGRHAFKMTGPACVKKVPSRARVGGIFDAHSCC